MLSVRVSLLQMASALPAHLGTGPWYLTELLIPALLRGKETSADGYARVITTSSSGAYFTPLHWGTFTDTPERKKIPTMVLYFQSKLVWYLSLSLKSVPHLSS